MTESGKSRWQQEFDALPDWAQKLVLGLTGCAGYGGGAGGGEAALMCGMASVRHGEFSVFHAILKEDQYWNFQVGIFGASDLAKALTAPWPPPEAPKRERRVFNIVEMAASGEDDDCAFDQPCAFGHRVESHAVYCHNEAWPGSPRKCRRRRDDPEHRHEDCPGFVANPDATLADT